MTRPDEPQTPRTNNFLEGENPDMMSWPEFARQLELELIGSRRIIDEMGEELRKAQVELMEADQAAKRWWRAASPYATPTALCEALAKAEKDTARLDGIQKLSTGYGRGWVLRFSTNGRGLRLHETDQLEANKDIRAAIDAAIKP